MNTDMQVRYSLAKVYTTLAEVAAHFDMYWFAGKFVDLAEALMDELQSVDGEQFDELTRFADKKCDGLELLSVYAKDRGYGAACALGRSIDADNAAEHGEKVPTPTKAPERGPVLLGPKGFTDVARVAEACADAGIVLTGKGGDA
jgi:hypothetical protein